MSKISYLVALFAAIFVFNVGMSSSAQAHRSYHTTTHKVVTKHCYKTVKYVTKRHYRHHRHARRCYTSCHRVCYRPARVYYKPCYRTYYRSHRKHYHHH